MLIKKILLVDDRPKNLIALEAILDAPDRELITAESGMDALKLLIKHSFSLILLDVQMPEMDGMETAELARANKKNQQVPIIFVTAITEGDQKNLKAMSLGQLIFYLNRLTLIWFKAKVDKFLSVS